MYVNSVTDWSLNITLKKQEYLIHSHTFFYSFSPHLCEDYRTFVGFKLRAPSFHEIALCGYCAANNYT